IFQENYVFMLNKHAIDMTMNWLCMTREMDGVHDSSLFVTMDSVASAKIKDHWPAVSVLQLDIEPLMDSFNYGEGPYQLFYLLRSNLARAFLLNDVTFWMTQQDTFWRAPLSSLDLSEYADADIVFDRASPANVTFIAGGYYRARSSSGALRFFDELSEALSWWYTPDNAFMSSLCRRRSDTTKCAHLPFDAIPNWKWLYDHPAADWADLPPLLQFDGETQLGGKLETMRKLGFKFLSDPGSPELCTQRSNNRLGGRAKTGDGEFKLSLAHVQFCVYQAIVDCLYSFPPSSLLLDYVILPAAHFFMLTM
ncbi:hypothetical protein PENTCL1PPCAC_25886, partial [Pristionchus entomophagus]